MPVSANGVRPDVVINPHAIPSRMTIAQLLETLLGKAVALDGRHGDGTPFAERDVLAEAGDILQARGFQRHGNETFYDGATGQKLRTELFVGVAYYQRLKHCAADKIHSRATHGKVQVLTRQPNEGRARGGGLRLGEMERDGLLSQGVSAFIKVGAVPAPKTPRLILSLLPSPGFFRLASFGLLLPGLLLSGLLLPACFFRASNCAFSY